MKSIRSLPSVFTALSFLFCLVYPLFAIPVSSADQELIKRNQPVNLPSYKENKNGLIKITDPETIELIELFMTDNISGYYLLDIARGERTSIVLPESGNFLILIPENIEEYAFEIKHESKITDDEVFVPSQGLIVITGDSSKHNMNIRITRIQEFKSKHSPPALNE